MLPSGENYTKLCFDAKQLENGVVYGEGIFGALFQKGAISGQYQMLS